jgi:hypothetical protein
MDWDRPPGGRRPLWGDAGTLALVVEVVCSGVLVLLMMVVPLGVVSARGEALLEIHRQRRFVLFLALAGSALVGCTSLLGDFTVADADAGGDTSVATGSSGNGAGSGSTGGSGSGTSSGNSGGSGSSGATSGNTGDAGSSSDSSLAGDGQNAPDAGTGSANDGGVDARADAPITTGQCQLPQIYSQACRPCVHSHCCTQEQACAQDPNCSQYVACILRCDQTYGCATAADTGCQMTCSGTYSAGYRTFNGSSGVDICVFSGCGQSCEMSCFSQ